MRIFPASGFFLPHLVHADLRCTCQLFTNRINPLLGLSLYTVVFPPDCITTSVATQERYRICELSNRINRRAPMDDNILKNPELLKMQIELEESNYRYAFELQKDIGLLLRIKHHIRYLKETLERLNSRKSSLSKKQTPSS